MRKTILLLIALISLYAKAQQNLSVGAPDQAGVNYGSVNFVDMSSLGQKQVEDISYADIMGSPYWDDNWNSALLFMNNNNAVKVQKAKLNLYTNEVHFINKSGTELAAGSDEVKKIVFFKGSDTSKILNFFEALADSPNVSKVAYYKVLNNGKYRLLEFKKISLKEGDYNPTLGKKEYSFVSQVNYSINDINSKVAIPVKLNQSNLLPIIKPSSEAYGWLKERNNKLKNIEEVVSFLNYYNGVIRN